MRLISAHVFLAAILTASHVHAEPGPVAYGLPEGFAPDAGTRFDQPAELLDRSIRTILSRAPVWERKAARRALAALGETSLGAVVEALRGGDRQARRDLITAVADIQGDASFGLLEAATLDPSWSVRDAAARGLGLTGRPEAVDAVRPLLEDPVWRVRRSAVVTLRQLAQTVELENGEEVRRILSLRLEDPDRDVRRETAWAVLRLGHLEALDRAFTVLWRGPRSVRERALTELPTAESPVLIEILDRAVKDPDNELAFRAAERLAAIRGVEILDRPVLRERLRDALIYRRDRAAIAVLRRLRGEALPFIIETLERRGRDLKKPRPDWSTPTARHILDLLASVGGKDAIPEFRRIIEESRDHHVLKLAIEVGRLAFPKPLEESFRRRYQDENDVIYEIQARLLKALAASNMETAAPLLAEAAESGTLALQRAVHDVVSTLGKACDREGLLLAIVDNSRNQRLLGSVLSPLAQVLGPRGPEVLLPLLRDTDLDLRIRAHVAGALTVVESEPVAEALRKLFFEVAPLADDVPETLEEKEALRRVILGALPFAAPTPDHAFFARAIEASEIPVREAAAMALGRDPGEGAAAVLLAAIDREPEDSVRKEIIRALAKCPGEVVDARLEELLRDGRRSDLLDVLAALQTVERSVPPAIREGLFGTGWDPNLRAEAARVVVINGDEKDLERLVALLAKGAPAEVELVILTELGERKAVDQVPGLLALLPTGDPAEIEPGRRDFVWSILLCLGKIGDARAAEPLRELVRNARPAPDAAPRELDEYRVEVLGLAADALARVDPEGALPDLLELALDPTIAVLLTERRVKILEQPFQRIAAGLQRVSDARLEAALDETLRRGLRSGRSLALPPEHLRSLADAVADAERKRPRRDAAARIRKEILALPPRISPSAYEAASDLAGHQLFRGTGAMARVAAERAVLLLELDPPKTMGADERREKVTLYRALGLAGEGIVAGDAGRAEERLALFDRAAALDPAHKNVAYYLGWTGLVRRLPMDRVQAWTERAAALTADEDDRYRYTVLDLVGVVLQRLEKPERAELYLRRAHEASLLRKTALIAWHLALVRLELGRPEAAKPALLHAFEKDDNYWGAARRDPKLEGLRKAGVVEELIEKAAETFD